MNNNYDNYQGNMGYGQPQQNPNMMNQQPMPPQQPMMNQQQMVDPNMMQPQPMMNQQQMVNPNMMQPQPMMNQQQMANPNMMQPQPMMNQQQMVDPNMMQPQPMNNNGFDSNSMVNNIFTVNNSNSASNVSQVPANMGKGIIGAIVGSLIGTIVLVLIYQIGKVAAVSGIAIAALTILGYEKLGGQLTKKSLGICVIIMIAAVFIGHSFGMALYVSSELGKLGYNISTFEIFIKIFSYIEDGIIVSDVFWSNLFLNYLFCGIGGFFIVKDKFKQIKNS